MCPQIQTFGFGTFMTRYFLCWEWECETIPTGVFGIKDREAERWRTMLHLQLQLHSPPSVLLSSSSSSSHKLFLNHSFSPKSLPSEPLTQPITCRYSQDLFDHNKTTASTPNPSNPNASGTFLFVLLRPFFFHFPFYFFNFPQPSKPIFA